MAHHLAAALAAQGMDGYLSPEWQYSGTDDFFFSGDGQVKEGEGVVENDVIELVTNELTAYILSFLRASRKEEACDDDELSLLERAVAESVALHRDLNVAYCRKLLAFTARTHQQESSSRSHTTESTIKTYLESAPGPWREAVLVQFLSLPVASLQRSVSPATSARTDTAIDNDDESIRSTISAPRTTISNGSGEESGSQVSKKVQKLQALAQRLKTENAVMRDRLIELRGVDVDRLQEKLRGSALDMQTIRSRNVELKDRVQVLEAQLHEALSSLSSNGGGGAFARRVRINTKSARSEQDEDDIYSDAGSVPAPSVSAQKERAEMKKLESEIAQLRKTVKTLEIKNGASSHAGQASASKASATSAASAVSAVATAAPLQKPPPFATTMQTLIPSLSPSNQKALLAAFEAWIDYETAQIKETDRKVIQGLLEELRSGEMLPAEGGGSGGGGGDGDDLDSSSAEAVPKSTSVPAPPSARAPFRANNSHFNSTYSIAHVMAAFLLGATLLMLSEGLFQTKLLSVLLRAFEEQRRGWEKDGLL